MKFKKLKFFRKLFSIFLCLFVLFSSFFAVDAQTISGTTTISDFKVNSVDFVVSRNGMSYDGGSVSTTEVDGGSRLRLNLTSDVGTLANGDKVTVIIELYPNISALRNSQNNVTGSFVFGMKADSSTMHSYQVYRESTVGTTQEADKSLSSGWGDYWTCNFNDASIGSSYDSYWIMFDYTVDADFTTYARYIYLQDFNFYYQNAQEYETDRIINNQDKNTDKIVQNQDENTQAIIDNENQNHDETLYGGPDYEEKDDTAVNDYSAADEELNSATSDAQDDSISFINNFGSLFDSSYVGKGLLACTSIFKQLFSIDWLSDIISFSLTLGIFAFILGSASSIVSRMSANYRYNEAKERRDSHNKTKGG